MLLHGVCMAGQLPWFVYTQVEIIQHAGTNT